MHPDLVRARAFFASVPTDAHLVIYADFDADGVSSATLLARARVAQGHPEPTVHLKSRFAPAWSTAAKEAVAALRPDALIVADLGVQAPGFLPGVPTLYLDHHIPLGVPDGAVVCVAHDWDPVPCTAWLAYELARPWLSDDALWVAAVGVLSDMGDKAPWPHMPEFRSRFKITHVREAVTLCNAARRAADPIPELAYANLRVAEGPKDVGRGEHGNALNHARREVSMALKRARGQKPLFADDGPWVHLPCRSRCQVHPLIASQWANRLPKYVVLASNDGYLEGWTAFSSRTRTDLDIPRTLRALPFASEHTDTFGHGHPAASGGQLPDEVFGRLLAALKLPIA